MKLGARGSVLFETSLGILLLVAVLYRLQGEVGRRWRLRLESLDEKRLRYDGEKTWRP